MREQVRDKGRLEHILQAIDKVFEFTKDVRREDFKKDSILLFQLKTHNFIRINRDL